MNSLLLQYMSKYQKKLVKLIKLGKAIIEKRIDDQRELIALAYAGVDVSAEVNLYDYLEPDQLNESQKKFIVWRTQCRHLLHQLPIKSTIYKDLVELLEDDKKCECLTIIDIQTTIIKLESLLEDYQDGLLDNIIFTVEAESSLNYIEQAKEFFDQEYYGAAGLIATTALEGFLKSVSKSISKENINNIDDNKESPSESKVKEDKTTLTKLAKHLRSQNYIDKSAFNEIIKWSDLRNKLAHGDLNISKDVVRELIMEINSFISSRISHI